MEKFEMKSFRARKKLKIDRKGKKDGRESAKTNAGKRI